MSDNGSSTGKPVTYFQLAIIILPSLLAVFGGGYTFITATITKAEANIENRLELSYKRLEDRIRLAAENLEAKVVNARIELNDKANKDAVKMLEQKFTSLERAMEANAAFKDDIVKRWLISLEARGL